MNVRIGDYFERLNGTSITAEKMKRIEDINGDVRIFAGGKTAVNIKYDDIPEKDIIKIPAVIVQSRGLIDFIYYDKPFSFKNEMWAYTADSVVTVKYLYYYLKNNVGYFRNIGSEMGSMPQISLKVTEKFTIPLPSLEDQQIIVDILDKFDKLTNDFNEGIPSEIDKRIKQYEHYRNELLNFKKLGN